MLRQLAVISLLSSSIVLAQDLPKELYMPNESGGYIVLTTDACPNAGAVKLGYNYRAYATETEGDQPATHEGCWDSPSLADAPRSAGIKIIPLVNLWFDGDVVTFPQTLFGPEKKRWNIAPTIEVKPNV
jgi:hypothetical protein